MLQRSLSEHAAGCFYGDERVAKRLWSLLLDPPKGHGEWKSIQDECYYLLVESVDMRHPREHRLTDIRQLMGRLCQVELLCSPGLPWLDQLGDKLFRRNGDLIYYREDCVQDYVRLSAELDPAILVGWRLADWIQQQPRPTAMDIHRVMFAQSPFFAPPDNTQLPFAEGHVHFGGITSADAFFDEYFFTDQTLEHGNRALPWKKEQYDILIPLLTRAKSLLSLLLLPTNYCDLEKKKQKYDNASSKDSHKDDKEHLSWQERVRLLHNPMHNQSYLPDWSILSSLHANAETGEPDWVLGRLAQALSQGEHNRWLWLQLYLCRSYQAKNSAPLERVAILCFWQTLNALRRRIIMDGQGLTRFAERYYAGPLRKSKSANKGNIRQLFVGSKDVAEIKASLHAFSSPFATAFSTSLVDHTHTPRITAPYIFGEHEIKPSFETREYLNVLERWQYCGHFSRSSSPKRGKRAKVDLLNNWKIAETVLKKLSIRSGWNQGVFLGGYLNPHFHFQPQNWFRGLDVAGDENALKIAGFSPMLRWLRNTSIPSMLGDRASPSFHFSIHAGEDYAHPVSGMRHVDETVRFCEMREGDRLGHALALGIEPSLWAKRQGEMLLPLDEHLDNLVWLWHYATVLSGRLPLAQQVVPLLERRIARFYPKCDWCKIQYLNMDHNIQLESKDSQPQLIGHITPDILYRAWLYRRNCYYRFQQLFNSMPITSKEKCALPDWSRLADKDNVAGQLYMQRHSYLIDDESPQLVLIRVENEFETQEYIGVPDKQILRQHDVEPLTDIIEDVETPAELEFMHALQDYLLDHYDQMGLIIETNPTSNIYIARLDKHAEHPIFRWSPPDEETLIPGAKFNKYGLRRGPVRVLINTDDPGIMPTTLRTEFLLLRDAALEQGISRTIAENWLEKIRQYGIEQFHRNHEPVFKPV